jgi:hypothetical protein
MLNVSTQLIPNKNDSLRKHIALNPECSTSKRVFVNAAENEELT